MNSLQAVASATASTVNSAWKSHNRFAQFTVSDTRDNTFIVKATGVTATQAAEPPGLPPGVTLVGQSARANDFPGSTGFVWEAEYVWHRPFVQWLSELIATIFMRIFVVIGWLILSLAVVGVLSFVGYLAIGTLKTQLHADEEVAVPPPAPSPCPQPSPGRAQRRADVPPSNEVPIEECRGDMCNVMYERN